MTLFMWTGLLFLLGFLIFPSGINAEHEECTAGWFGFDCTYNCSEHCRSTDCRFSKDKFTPECHDGCVGKRTGVFCQEFCPSLCLECHQYNSSCKTCTSGYFGPSCNQTCNILCEDGRCNADGSCSLTSRTKTGSWKEKLTALNQKDNCLIRKDRRCTCCRTKHRGENCKITCENCQTFYTPNDICQYQCKAGYYGSRCDNMCPKNCVPGNDGKPICMATTEKTIKCVNGCNPRYYGLQCSSFCSKACTNGTCYQLDGRCVGCSYDKYGDRCEKTCSEGCVNRTCHRNGSCVHGCITERYKETCIAVCPLNCFREKSINEVCKLINGNQLKCLQGCKLGYYSWQCNATCNSNCKDKMCDQDGGKCSKGCIDGFYGEKCTKLCGVNCENRKCEFQISISAYSCTDGCLDGYMGYQCEDNCPDHCKICKRIGRQCTVCQNNFTIDDISNRSQVCIPIPQVPDNVNMNDARKQMPHFIIVAFGVLGIAIFTVIVGIIWYLRKKRRSNVPHEERRSNFPIQEEMVGLSGPTSGYSQTEDISNVSGGIVTQTTPLINPGRGIRPDVKIAIITSLPSAKLAVDAMMEEKNTRKLDKFRDYTIGKIGPHMVLSFQLQRTESKDGSKTLSRRLTKKLFALSQFKEIKHIFFAGVAGAFQEKCKIILGDVIISHCKGGEQGVYFSLGHKGTQGEQKEDDLYTKTPDDQTLQRLADKLADDLRMNREYVPWVEYIEQGQKLLQVQNINFDRPQDILVKRNVTDPLLERNVRVPNLHFGALGHLSGDVRNANKISFAKKHNIYAFDTGIHQVLESIYYDNRTSSFMIIRGIADYKDGSEGRDWVPYAALASAAVVKTMILTYLPEDL